MTQAFTPTEIFKRATASTLRAIAERDDVTVGFGPEPPGVAGTRVKLPNPARDLPADEAAQLRGARRLRRARTGPRRGARIAAHGRGRRQSLRDARRAIPPPRLRAHHRADRKHD